MNNCERSSFFDDCLDEDFLTDNNKFYKGKLSNKNKTIKWDPSDIEEDVIQSVTEEKIDSFVEKLPVIKEEIPEKEQISETEKTIISDDKELAETVEIIKPKEETEKDFWGAVESPKPKEIVNNIIQLVPAAVKSRPVFSAVENSDDNFWGMETVDDTEKIFIKKEDIVEASIISVINMEEEPKEELKEDKIKVAKAAEIVEKPYSIEKDIEISSDDDFWGSDFTDAIIENSDSSKSVAPTQVKNEIKWDFVDDEDLEVEGIPTTEIDIQPQTTVHETLQEPKEEKSRVVNFPRHESKEIDIDKEIRNVRSKYIIGKVAGEDLLDSNNKTIVKKGYILTEAVVKRAEEEGKLVELIINMSLPEKQ